MLLRYYATTTASSALKSAAATVSAQFKIYVIAFYFRYVSLSE